MAASFTPAVPAAEGCCPPGVAIDISEAEAEAHATWFKALADPTRIRILNLLARHREPLCVCDIVSHFDLGQPAISHHLKVLRDAGFVSATRRANFAYYHTTPEALDRFSQVAHQIMNRD